MSNRNTYSINRTSNIIKLNISTSIFFIEWLKGMNENIFMNLITKMLFLREIICFIYRQIRVESRQLR